MTADDLDARPDWRRVCRAALFAAILLAVAPTLSACAPSCFGPYTSGNDRCPDDIGGMMRM